MVFLLTFDTEEEKTTFSTLYNKYAQLMLRVARFYLQGSPDAEDVVHEAFIYIADHLDKIDYSDQQKTRSYLALVTKHKAIDHLRTKHQDVPLDEQLLDTSLMEGTKWEESEDLAKALQELSPEYRDIILFHYYYGYTFRETADLLHQSTFAISGKARRAIQKLKQILSKPE